MRIETEVKLDFKDVLIKPQRSTLFSRKEVNLNREFVFKHSKANYHGFPLIAANMDSVGTFEMAVSLEKFNASTALHKHYTEDELVEYFSNIYFNGYPVFYSMGVREDDYTKFVSVMQRSKNAIQYVCIDVANGYSERFVAFIKRIREEYPHLTIMAGNVVTGDMASQLILSGADIVKVGIGPGSVCTTRKVAGVGYPQLSAIIECADATHGLGGLVCADGGCTTPGDVSKAFGAGADFVMLGGMLAGHDECGGEIVKVGEERRTGEFGSYVSKQGEKFVRFYGMSSSAAMNKHHGGVAEYRASEGKEVLVPYRGPVANTMKEIMGGVRSTCTYVGAAKLKELSKRCTFVMCNRTHNTVYGE